MIARAPRRALLASSFFLLAQGAAPLLADTLVLANGNRTENVQVTMAKHDNVQYKPSTGPAVTLAANTVQELQRDSNLLQGARAALAAGDWEKALKDFTSSASSTGAADWEKAEAAYRIGLCHQGAGRYKEAEAAFKAYREKHEPAKDFHVPFSIRDLAHTYLLLRQPGSAELEFRKLEPFGGHWVVQSKLGQAEAILAKGPAEAAKALALAAEVARNTAAPPRLRQRAHVLRARALLLQGQHAQAQKDLEANFFAPSKAAEVDYSPERATATLLMGRALLAQGGKENMEQAEVWFLRVSALFKKYGDVYAQACDGLAETYEKLGRADRASEWRARKPAGAPQAAAPGASEGGAAPRAARNGKK
jgi:tetratricopeptide (TPR) repeat protein